MLKHRVLTALLLLPLVVGAVIYLPQSMFAFLFGAIILAAGWEWSGLLETDPPLRALYLALLGMLMLMSERLLGAEATGYIALAWWLFSFYWVVGHPASTKLWRSSPMARALAGLMVLIPTFICFVALRAVHGHGVGLTMLLLLIIWAADTGAYFAGRAFGKHKLAPKVSPGKSWEGVVGGLLLALAVAAAGHVYLALPYHWVPFMLLSLLTVAISIQGDLFESLFKRICGVKDSGGLLPGHGGLLDRIDSLTAAAPIFYLGVLWLS